MPTRSRRILTLGLPLALACGLALAGPAPGRAATEAPPVEKSDPWSAVQLIRPADLAATLRATGGEKPLLLHVGFKVLYHGGAIPGSHYVGPCSKPEGIAALQREVKGVAHDRSIVVYCGCCPWDHCPNMRPAFRTLAKMGFRHVHALYVAKDLDHDWADAGYPIEKPKD